MNTSCERCHDFECLWISPVRLTTRWFSDYLEDNHPVPHSFMISLQKIVCINYKPDIAVRTSEMWSEGHTWSVWGKLKLNRWIISGNWSYNVIVLVKKRKERKWSLKSVNFGFRHLQKKLMRIEFRIFVTIKVVSEPWVGGCAYGKGPWTAGKEEEAKAVFPATLTFLTTDTDEHGLGRRF